jgi:hypothetical protein
MNPALYLEGNSNGPGGSPLKMIPKPLILAQELADAHHRTFVFGRGAGTDKEPVTITEAQGTNSSAPSIEIDDVDDFEFEVNGLSVNVAEGEGLPHKVKKPWGIKTDGGKMLVADMHRVDAAPKLGDLEVWHIVNGGGGWSHNVHVHFEEGQILERDGRPPPDWEKWARKDVYRVGRMDDSGSEVVMAIRFREFAGAYMEHCHNTQHEDHAMLLRWDIENPGQLKPFLTPEPQWNGCSYTESHAAETARTQEYGRDRAPEAIGDWMEKTDFEAARDLRQVLCAAGHVEACSATESLAGSASASGEVPAPQDVSAASSEQPSQSSLAETSEPSKKKRRGRRRGGRHGGSGSRHSQDEGQ